MTNHCKSCTCPQEKPVACEHEFNGGTVDPRTNEFNGECNKCHERITLKPQPLVPVEELRQGENSTIPQDMSTVWHKLNEVIRRLNLLANK